MSIYKECDIRGVYGKDLASETAYLLGRAVGTKLEGRTAVVGGDARTSTPLLSRRLIEGLTESGSDVIDIGLVPTPVVYFAKNVLSATACIHFSVKY